MHVSQLFGETFRETPAGATLRSHELLLRAGYLRELGAGTTAILPMGWRAIERMYGHIQKTFSNMGAQSIRIPLLQPPKIWQQSGFLPTAHLPEQPHHLSISGYPAAAALSTDIRSYRQLPQLWQYRQPLFRDPNATPGGWMNAIEAVAHQVVVFERSATANAERFALIAACLHDIFSHFHLPVSSVTAEHGRQGEDSVQKLIYPMVAGSEKIAICENCSEGAMLDVARFKKTPFSTDTPKPLQKVPTPDANSIDALCKCLEIDPRTTAKMVFLMATVPDATDEILFICVVRGDMDISEALVRQATQALALRPASGDEIASAGCSPGYASPIGICRDKARVIVDDLIPKSSNLVTGANEPGFHLMNSNYERDYTADIVAPVAQAPPGCRCAACGNPLYVKRGESVAELRNFDTFYSKRFDTAYLNENGKPHPLYMSGFSLNLHKTLACIAEAHHDNYGLIMPAAVTPFDIALLQLKGDAAEKQATDLYKELKSAGYSVLWDDRKVSPGIMFNDADLRGIPLRITVSERSLEKGGVEVKWRSEKERSVIPLSKLLDHIHPSAKHDNP